MFEHFDSLATAERRIAIGRCMLAWQVYAMMQIVKSIRSSHEGTSFHGELLLIVLPRFRVGKARKERRHAAEFDVQAGDIDDDQFSITLSDRSANIPLRSKHTDGLVHGYGKQVFRSETRLQRTVLWWSLRR